MTRNNRAALASLHTSSAEERKEELEMHGYAYYDSPRHPGLIELADDVGAQAAKALLESDIFEYNAGLLLIAETMTSYELQYLVVKAVADHGYDEDVYCAIDCKPEKDEVVKDRYVSRTTVYVYR